MNDRKASAVFSWGSKTWPALLIGTTILIGFWQLSSCASSLKYDALDLTLPWRYFAADALRNGVLPWWNPYQLQGFAQGSSPETWYPIGLILGYWRGYSISSLNLEFLIHLVLSSWGFFRLSRAIGLQQASSFFGALVFPMTGFFIGHAQHIGWIIAGCWIPHLLASFIHFNKDLDWRHGVSFVVCLFMMVSGGYPGLSIATCYIIACLGIWYLIRNKSIQRHTRVTQYMRLSLLSILTCAIILACFLQLKESLFRGQGLNGEESLIGSSYLKHFSSLFFPLASVKGTYEQWNADQSVINSYVGLLTLVFVGLALYRWEKFGAWLALAVVPLLLSLGVELPFRLWANHLPFFDLFRFPGLFRYFFILVLLIVAAATLDDFLKGEVDLRNRLVKPLKLMAYVSSALCIYWLVFEWQLIVKIMGLSIDSVKEAIVFQSFIISILTWSLFFALHLFPASKTYLIIMLFTALDLGIMIQSNGRVSVFQEQPLNTYRRCLNELPMGYPMPSLRDPLGTNEDKLLHIGPLYRNTSLLFKQPSGDGYSPFQYNGYVSLNNSSYYNKTLRLPFAHLSFLDPPPDSLDFLVSRPVIRSDEKLNLVDFDINQSLFTVDVPHPRLLVVNQNFLQGWKAEIDGIDSPIEKVDVNLIGIRVPAGKSRVRLHFIDGPLKNTLIISSILFVGLVIILSWVHLPIKWMPIALLLPILYMVSSSRPRLNKLDSDNGIAPETPLVTNAIDEDASQGHDVKDRFLDFRDFQRFRELVKNQRSNFLFTSRSLCMQEPYFTNYLARSQDIDSVDDRQAIKGILVYPKISDAELMYSFNGFEGYAHGWNRSTIDNPYESSGNRYERLENEKFSATWTDSLHIKAESRFSLKLDVLTRCINASGAGLVYSIITKDEVVLWKSYPLKKNQREDNWTRTTWQNKFTLSPGKYAIRVQIWNPAKRTIELDDFEILLERL